MEPATVLYGFSLAYLVAPGTFDSAHVIEFVGTLPDAVKIAGKAILAAPFAFHGWNGLRHLAWDMNKCESSGLSLVTAYVMLNATRSPDYQGRVLDGIRGPRCDRRLHCRAYDDVIALHAIDVSSSILYGFVEHGIAAIAAPGYTFALSVRAQVQALRNFPLLSLFD